MGVQKTALVDKAVPNLSRKRLGNFVAEMLGNVLRNYRQFVAKMLGKLEFDFPFFRDLLGLYLSQIKYMVQASGGFTEYEWFGENLSICRYARSKSVCLDYFLHFTVFV